MPARYPTTAARPLREAAPTVVYQGRPYYANAVDELVQMTDCTCGVSYDPDCPVAKHREHAEAELAENSGVHQFPMTEEQITARREFGEQLYAKKTKRRDRPSQALLAMFL